MLVRTTAISVAAVTAGLLILLTPPAGALTMKECSAKYQAAKTSGTRPPPSATIDCSGAAKAMICRF
jgi:hypothetical protein